MLSFRERILHESTCTVHLTRKLFDFNKTQSTMCCRSARSPQEHIKSDRDFYVIHDVTGVTGWILGVPDLQPGRGAPTSALQGP